MDLLVSVGILLFIAGFILVGIEMVVPGFGFPGISGIICLIAGILLTAKDVEQGLTITVIVVVILSVMLTVVMMVLKRVKSPMNSRLLSHLRTSPIFMRRLISSVNPLQKKVITPRLS